MYDKASIALIPSGTKTGKLYSVLPANGNGDFIFERGSTATRVNKDGLIESVSADIPRLDYPITNGVVGDCPHLLLEPSRTNKNTYSEDFSSYLITPAGTVSITPNYGISPSGELNSTRVVFDANSALYKFVAHSVNEEYSSLYVKGVSGETIKFGRGTVANAGEIFTLTGDWQRLEDTSTTGNQFSINTFSGVTARDIEIWGAQVEEGSYATSYIPTSGFAETRLADSCYDSGTSAEFNDSEGVLFAEVEFLDNANTGYISVSDGTADNRCIIYSAANQIVVATKSGGSGISKSATGTPTNLNKIAVAYSSSGSKFFLNGSNETGTGSFSTTPRVFAANTLDQINFDISDGSNDLYARVKQVIYFNEVLSDSELQTLTS